ncbi:TPA: radical SAM protein [Enterococcus faecium]
MKVTTASVDITYRCNLLCKHCYNSSGDLPDDYFERVLTHEQYENILYDLAKMQLSTICFCGGETLLEYKFILDILPKLKKIAPNTSLNMVSDGLLFTEKKALALKEAGLNSIQFSLDGITNYSYDFIRGTKNGVARVKKAFDIAKKVGLELAVAILPHKRNIHEIDEIIEYCLSVPIPNIRLQPFMPIGRGSENQEDIKLNASEYRLLRIKLAIWQQKLAANNSKVSIEWGDPLDHFFMLQEEMDLPYIAINAYGEISLSPYLPFVIWNLKEQNLDKFFESQITKEVFSIPLVSEVLDSIIAVDNLVLDGFDLPQLYREENLRLDKMLQRREIKQ